MQCFVTPQGGAKPAESCWTASVLWGYKWSPILSARCLQLLEQSHCPHTPSKVSRWFNGASLTLQGPWDNRQEAEWKPETNNMCCLWTPKPVKTSTSRERSKSTTRSQSMTRERSRRPFTPVAREFVNSGYDLHPICDPLLSQVGISNVRLNQWHVNTTEASIRLTLTNSVLHSSTTVLRTIWEDSSQTDIRNVLIIKWFSFMLL